MTFIKPESKSRWFGVFMTFMVVALLCGTSYLITIYNQTVRLSQEVAAARTALNTIGAENTTLNNQIITTLGNVNQLSAIATSDGLVIAHPQYVTIP
jgi:cell division protein FtsB